MLKSEIQIVQKDEVSNNTEGQKVTLTVTQPSIHYHNYLLKIQCTWEFKSFESKKINKYRKYSLQFQNIRKYENRLRKTCLRIVHLKQYFNFKVFNYKEHKLHNVLKTEKKKKVVYLGHVHRYKRYDL